MEYLLSHLLFYFDLEEVSRKIVGEAGGLLPLALVLTLELIISGWNQSSVKQLTRPTRSDWWDIFSSVAFILNGRRILSNIFYFGGISYLLALTSDLRLHAFDSWPIYAKLIIAFLCRDFFLYWSHRWKHIWPFAWIAHEFHHSSTRVSALVSYRVHPLDFAFSFLWVFLPFRIIFGLELGETLWFVVLTGFFGFFSHSRVDTNLGWVGSWLLVTPRFHHLHHSVEVRHQKKNFGEGLVVWDRLFGTYAAPDLSIYQIKTGLEDDDIYHGPRPWLAYLRPVLHLYEYPFKFFRR